MFRRHIPLALTGLVLGVFAAPVLWRHDSLLVAAADPLLGDDAPAPTNVIHLAQLALSDQDQAPAATDRDKSVQPRATQPTTAATKPLKTDQAQTGLPSSLSAETVMSCLEVARDIDPELGRELMRKHDKNPVEFEQALRTGHVGRGLWSLLQLRQRDPHLYRLKISEMTQSLQINRKAAELQQASQTADTGRIDSLKAQLRELLQLQLAMSLKARAEYLCAIEDQVKKLRDEIDHDAANFHGIIDARLKQFIDNPPQTDPASIIPTPATKTPDQPRTAAPTIGHTQDRRP